MPPSPALSSDPSTLSRSIHTGVPQAWLVLSLQLRRAPSNCLCRSAWGLFQHFEFMLVPPSLMETTRSTQKPPLRAPVLPLPTGHLIYSTPTYGKGPHANPSALLLSPHHSPPTRGREPLKPTSSELPSFQLVSALGMFLSCLLTTQLRSKLPPGTTLGSAPALSRPLYVFYSPSYNTPELNVL